MTKRELGKVEAIRNTKKTSQYQSEWYGIVDLKIDDKIETFLFTTHELCRQAKRILICGMDELGVVTIHQRYANSGSCVFVYDDGLDLYRISMPRRSFERGRVRDEKRLDLVPPVVEDTQTSLWGKMFGWLKFW